MSKILLSVMSVVLVAMFIINLFVGDRETTMFIATMAMLISIASKLEKEGDE